jgi:hypothetical protein
MSDEERFIPGIYNYCDRWCERCGFTSRCRLFADEGKLRARIERGEEPDEGEDDGDEANAAFWDMLDEVTADALTSWEDELPPEVAAEIEARQSRLDELTERDPLVQLAHDYSRAAHQWIERHEADLPDEANRFRARRDAITPAEALEVIAWHEFQITAKLARATRGRLEAEEEQAEQDEDWDAVGNWTDDEGDWSAEDAADGWEDDEEEIDMAAIHQSDADGSARVALLGIERSIGAWTILRNAYPQDDAQIQDFLRRLTRLRRLLEQALPNARTFHRPGFDD